MKRYLVIFLLIASTATAGLWNGSLFNQGTGTVTVTEEESGYSAKTVVVDIANRHGGNFLALRSIDFYLDDVLIPVTADDITADSTTEYMYSAPEYVFITALSKIDGHTTTGWRAATNWVTSQRIICVFDSAITFDSIVVNNHHEYGGDTDCGAKDTKIYITDSEYTTTTYNAEVTGGTKIFDGQLAEHSASNAVDNQTLELE